MIHPPSYYANEYKDGNLSLEAYTHMLEAYAYGAAGSINWLRSILNDLTNGVSNGKNVNIRLNDEELIVIVDMSSLLDWIAKTFPDVV